MKLLPIPVATAFLAPSGAGNLLMADDSQSIEWPTAPPLHVWPCLVEVFC